MKQTSPTGDPILRVAVIVIAATLGFGALKLGADIFAPMVLGLVTGVILAPLTSLFERLGLPVGVAATIVLILGVSGIAVLAVLMEPLVWRVIEALPSIKWELRSIIEEFRGLVRGLDAVNEEVEEALGTENSGAGEEDGAASPMPSLADTLYQAPIILSQVLIFGGTMFFFLLTRTGIYSFLSRWIGTTQDTAILLNRFTNAERLVSRYFLTITVINTVLGFVLGSALALIGLPGPIIWGFAAALLNFIVYAGPMVIAAGLLLAGLIAFEGLMILAPAAIFLVINMTEAQFVTPAMVGRYVAINPLLLFVTLVFWLWLWGPVGGIVAIPVLVIVLVMLNVFETDSTADRPGAKSAADKTA